MEPRNRNWFQKIYILAGAKSLYGRVESSDFISGFEMNLAKMFIIKVFPTSSDFGVTDRVYTTKSRPQRNKMVRNLKINKIVISKIGLFHDPEGIRGHFLGQILVKWIDNWHESIRNLFGLDRFGIFFADIINV